VLPGGRYAVLHVVHANFAGQLLVDSETGKYRELPEETMVYLNLNSWDYELPVFELFNPRDGKLEFQPAYKLRDY
jgi:hypothetical protein